MRQLSILLCFIVCSCHAQNIVNGDIVLVNVGRYDKGQLAKLIGKINGCDPKVISLDIGLSEYNGDVDDKLLYSELTKVENLVLPSKIVSEGENYYGDEVVSVYLACASEFFVPYARTGFVNAEVTKSIGEIPRQFAVWQKGSYSEDLYYHFSIVTAMAFDSLKAVTFIQRHERLTNVDQKMGKRRFRTFSDSEVLKGEVKKNEIEGKIVIIGFLGPGDQDKFLNPMNNGEDIYGVEFLANIAAQILDQGK